LTPTSTDGPPRAECARDGNSTSPRQNARLLPARARDKIVDWPVLLRLREAARAAGAAVVWTNGCFDLLHAGHVRNLEAARAFGDLLVVGINSDASVRGLKGPGRPVLPAAERCELVAALACVDYVVVFDQPVPLRAIALVQPDVHCKGADYAPPLGKPIPEAEIVTAAGGRLEFFPLVPGLSTTELILRIRQSGTESPERRHGD
jgi:D-glycero-beta-D-manno-heptose 1-phosphate adenylyltransferase